MHHQSGRSTIAWPVYLKDLNWYLFELPERPVNYEPGDDWNARTPGTAGSPNWPSSATWRGDKDLWDDVAHSAYGSADGQGAHEGARVDFPQCIPKAGNPASFDCYDPDGYVSGNDYDDSDLDEPFFPFYVAGVSDRKASGVLRADWLKQAGVAGPVDAAESGYGRNSRFDFTIRDGILYSQEGTGALGDVTNLVVYWLPRKDGVASQNG